MYLIIDPAVMLICDCVTRRRGAFGERIFWGKAIYMYEWEGGRGVELLAALAHGLEMYLIILCT